MNIIEEDLYQIFKKSQKKISNQINYTIKLNINRIQILSCIEDLDYFESNFGFRFDFNNKVILLHSILNSSNIETLKFLSILSFIQKEYLLNKAIFALLYLLNPWDLSNKLIRNWYDSLLNFANDQFKLAILSNSSFIEIFLKSTSIFDILTDFIPYISPNISSINLLKSLSQFFISRDFKSFELKSIKPIFKIITQFQNLIPNDITNREFLEEKTKYFNFFPIIISNYSTINLNTFYVLCKFSKEIKNPKKIINEFFLKIPYISVIKLNNQIFSFYCSIPKMAETYMINFLSYLKEIRVISFFDLYIYLSFEKHIKFESKLADSTKMHTLFPYNSKKYYQNINSKRENPFSLDFIIFSEIKKNFQSEGKKNPFDLDYLPLLFILQAKNLFSELKFFDRKKDFLDSIRKYINKSKMIFIKEKSHFLSQSSSNKPYFISDTYLDLYIASIEYFLRKYEKKKNYNDEILSQIINKLFHFENLALSKIETITQIFYNHDEIFSLFVISNNRIEWMENILFYYSVGLFAKSNEISNKIFIYHFFIKSQNFLLFTKLLLKEHIHTIGFNYGIIKNDIDPSLIHYYDYGKKQWINDFFSLDSLIRNDRNKRKYFYSKSDNDNLLFEIDSNFSSNRISYKEFFSNQIYFNNTSNISQFISSNRKIILDFFKFIYNNNHISANSINRFLPNLTSDIKNELFRSVSKYITFHPSLENKIKIIIIIQQSNSYIDPLRLIQNDLFRSLFSFGLINCWFFGGITDSILILEYVFPENLFYSDKSNFSRTISNIKLKYPYFVMKIYKFNTEIRFFNENSIFPVDSQYKEYLSLKIFENSKQNIANPNRIEYNYTSFTKDKLFEDLITKCKKENHFQSLTQDEKNLCLKNHIFFYPNFFKWNFWQIINYPITICIVIHPRNIKEEHIIQNFIEQLPIGKILLLDDIQNKSRKILSYIQIRDNISTFLSKITSIFTSLNINYYLSPIISIDIFFESKIIKIIEASRKNLGFITNINGDIFEFPLFIKRSRFKTYTIKEQVLIFDSINCLLPQIKSLLTHQLWKKIKNICAELYIAKELTQNRLISEIKKKFKFDND